MNRFKNKHTMLHDGWIHPQYQERTSWLKRTCSAESVKNTKALPNRRRAKKNAGNAENKQFQAQNSSQETDKQKAISSDHASIKKQSPIKLKVLFTTITRLNNLPLPTGFLLSKSRKTFIQHQDKKKLSDTILYRCKDKDPHPYILYLYITSITNRTNSGLETVLLSQIKQHEQQQHNIPLCTCSSIRLSLQEANFFAQHSLSVLIYYPKLFSSHLQHSSSASAAKKPESSHF